MKKEEQKTKKILWIFKLSEYPKVSAKRIKYFLLMIIFFAFLIRIYSLSSMNFYYDEAVYAMFAMDFVINSTSPWAGSAVQPPLFTWINSIPVSIFGISEFSIRLLSVLLGVFTIAIVYLLARKWYGEKVGLISASILAVMPLHVIYSRLAFNDITQVFLFLVSMLLLEYSGKKFYVLFAGIFFGLSYLIKYNVVIMAALYWIFYFAYFILKKDWVSLKKSAKNAIIYFLSSLVFIILVIYFTSGSEGLVYLINSTLFWISFQYSQSINPAYYYMAILFDSLSPPLYILSLIALLALLLQRNKKRNDYLIIFLVLAYILIISMQTRRFSRYLLFAIPFIAILLAKHIAASKIKHLAGAVVIIGLVWSTYEINNNLNFDLWRQAGAYVKTYYPDARIHDSFHKHRLVSYYISPSPDNSEYISTLKKSDLVIFTWLDENSTVLENSPFEDKSLFFDFVRKEYDQDFIDYVKKHGKLVKSFDYKEKTAIWIYQITSTGEHRPDSVKEEHLQKSSLFGIWDYVCKNRGKEPWIKKMMNSFLSQSQLVAADVKCRTLGFS